MGGVSHCRGQGVDMGGVSHCRGQGVDMGGPHTVGVRVWTWVDLTL